MAIHSIEINGAQVNRADLRFTNTIQRHETLAKYSPSDIANLLLLACLVLFSGAALYQIMQRALDPYAIPVKAPLSATIMSKETGALVERTIRHAHMSGQWQFQSSEFIDNVFHFTFKTNQPAQLATDGNKTNIQKTMCPNSRSYIWRFVDPRQVAFHLLAANQTQLYSGSCG